jgi:RNA polymerase sigma factor (sigma-70 family)
LKYNEEAQDVVQAVFVKLWEKWEEIDMEQSDRAYLYKWVHNRCLNTIRHEKIRANYVLSKVADQADLLNTIGKALKILREKLAAIARKP